MITSVFMIMMLDITNKNHQINVYKYKKLDEIKDLLQTRDKLQ